MSAKVKTAARAEPELEALILHIGEQIAAGEAELAANEARVRSLALSAAAGDAEAKAEVARLRGANGDLVVKLDDLRLGREDARKLLATTREARQAAAVRDEQARVREMIEERIQAAADFDAAATALQDAYERYASLGQRIMASPACPVGNYGALGVMNAVEQARGHTRVLAALPAMLQVFFPTAIFASSRTPLANSEAGTWPQAKQQVR